ncbi:MAG TPA: 2-succinyl-5-enolpyruvyl-6-hydroxy-3-cyclohexene-1-carboxylic-acid synthase [Solirubrobacterales bacterium]|jgi:2-succinyl-5-enolpyruvyl-6-hydroxy-3-cyclohexene-1-carboxylate synthase
MDSTNRNTALASALVEELARSGMRHAVICPGSRSTPVALALLREPAISTHSIVDERSAGFFALGAASATGRPVAIACTSGTAAANLHPAVAEAAEADVPLIVITSDRPPELRDVGAGQTIDQIKLYGTAARWFCEVGTHEADDAGLLHMRSVACRAYAVAAGDPRPGPVHLNLSWRDPLGPEPGAGDVSARSALAREGRGNEPLTRVARGRVRADEALVDALAERIAGTERGLILAGRGTDPACVAAITALAAASDYPILAEPTSGLRLGPHDRERVVWTYDAIARSRPAELAPELVLRFGELPTSKALRMWLADLPGAAQIQVDPVGSWKEPTRTAELVVRGDASDLAARLADRLSPRPSEWTRRWLGANEAVAAALGEGIASEPGLSEPAVLAALAGALRDGELVYTASSMPIRDQESFLPSGPADVRFLANRGANGIDGTVSSAAGAAAASARPTWLITGDLALHHDSNGLAALRDCDAPVRIVCLHNDGGGIFELLPQAGQVPRAEFEAIFGTPLGLDLERLAALHGLGYARLERAEDLVALPAAHVIAEARVERASAPQLRARIFERAHAALAGLGLNAPSA